MSDSIKVNRDVLRYLWLAKFGTLERNSFKEHIGSSAGADNNFGLKKQRYANTTSISRASLQTYARLLEITPEKLRAMTLEKAQASHPLPDNLQYTPIEQSNHGFDGPDMGSKTSTKTKVYYNTIKHLFQLKGVEYHPDKIRDLPGYTNIYAEIIQPKRVFGLDEFPLERRDSEYSTVQTKSFNNGRTIAKLLDVPSECITMTPAEIREKYPDTASLDRAMGRQTDAPIITDASSAHASTEADIKASLEAIDNALLSVEGLASTVRHKITNHTLSPDEQKSTTSFAESIKPELDRFNTLATTINNERARLGTLTSTERQRT